VRFGGIHLRFGAADGLALAYLSEPLEVPLREVELALRLCHLTLRLGHGDFRVVYQFLRERSFFL
jgi:hypothetical protein